ncbi:uncharacterized protein EDB91DRAFT_1250439 [Suillus paluster]|uniref:uncharacterized protein n=1 Tax=Suillus paluster TaxID=48578 RepID=UPI001B85FD31|nr:uncharacterized protein EDB91DRAFT_1250439 [Suillus paluster]KAG1735603.1 hypothetical protein EDB91DRAFT_1250439 [Suillus paluster]
MVGVVEQFSHLRNAPGSALGLFGLLRWMKKIIPGRPSSTNSIQGGFGEFINGKPVQGPMGPPAVKPSRKPIIIFLLQAQIGTRPLGPLDPSTLTFACALYPFTLPSPSELALKENEIVAIMGKLDPSTVWRWTHGWFPKKWVEVLERRNPAEEGKKVV